MSLNRDDTQQEHPLQAVVLCDPWGEELRWGPLARNDDYEEGQEARPWCLLPLLNTPLLAWTLECLAADGVEEIFIFVREGVNEVRDWLSTSTFMSPKSPLSIVFRPTTALTPGDVLREVDGLQILAPADFLVVQAGYVGNAGLGELVKDFTERRKRDPNLSMSCVVAPRPAGTTSKYAVHVVSSPDDRLHHYEESPLFPKLKQATLPREALDGCKEVRTRIDLESIGVAICSVEVPPLFTENFDYQFFYPDFVNGILTSDLLGKTICCTIIGEGSSTKRSTAWAGVVGNTRSYDEVSKAILTRRVYPFAPDENMPDDADRYEQRRGRVYLGKNLELSRTCTISSTSLVASHTTIGASSSIFHSVLSPHVTIGASCTISGSYIFPGATIGDDCSITDAIVGEDAVVGAGSVLSQGAIVGRRTKLGTGARLAGERVAAVEAEEDVEAPAESSLGEGHEAFFWPSEEKAPEEDEDEDDDELDLRNLGITRLGSQLASLHISHSSSSSSSLSSLSRASSTTSLSTLASASNPTDLDPPLIAGLSLLSPASGTPQSDFESECLASLERSFAESHTVDNAAIELKTLRMASNVPLPFVRDLVVPFVLTRATEDAKGVAEVVKRWGGLIGEVTGQEVGAMSETLLAAQRYCAAREGEERQAVVYWQRVLMAFYDEDIVSEDAVIAWWKSPAARSTGGERGMVLWVGAKPFIEKLMEESDEESEEESD